jgi:hypothetical protein
MPPIQIRVRANTQAGRFRSGPLQLGDRWSPVDLARPDVRDGLIAHVGVHVQVHPHDRAAVEAAGFRFDGDRMVVVGTPNAAAPPAATAAAEPAQPTSSPTGRRTRKESAERAA